TRDEITVGRALQPSPFYVDVFSMDGRELKHLNTATYQEVGDVSRIYVKWLQPAKHRGPILLLECGRMISDTTRWTLIAFPDGFRGKRVITRDFLTEVEGEDYYWVMSFDRTDTRGFLMIEERTRKGSDMPERVRTYHWNGRRFIVSGP